MAMVRDVIKQVDASTEATNEMKEALAMLSSLAQAKGDNARKTIESDLIAGPATDTLTVGISKVLTSRTEFRSIVEKDKSGITTKIGDSLGKMFTGDTGVLQGIAGIVDDALGAIMGAGKGEE